MSTQQSYNAKIKDGERIASPITLADGYSDPVPVRIDDKIYTYEVLNVAVDTFEPPDGLYALKLDDDDFYCLWYGCPELGWFGGFLYSDRTLMEESNHYNMCFGPAFRR